MRLDAGEYIIEAAYTAKADTCVKCGVIGNLYRHVLPSSFPHAEGYPWESAINTELRIALNATHGQHVSPYLVVCLFQPLKVIFCSYNSTQSKASLQCAALTWC